MDKPEELLNLPPEETIDIPEVIPEKGLSESVAESVKAAQSALEDSMQKAAALQMTAMQTAITEFKTATEEVKGLMTQVSGLLAQVDDLKAEALELVEALTPQEEDQEDQEGGGRIQSSTIGKPAHMTIIKKILSR